MLLYILGFNPMFWCKCEITGEIVTKITLVVFQYLQYDATFRILVAMYVIQ